MFTGLVQAKGRLVAIEPFDGRTQMRIECPWSTAELQHGESIAVDGVCLTVASQSDQSFTVDVIAETLSVTTLGAREIGHEVNLERALRAGDRLGGHIVQGHVDGTVRVEKWERNADDVRLHLRLSPELAPYVAFKGSVTLQGVSLTVAAVTRDSFQVALIPVTLAETTLANLEVGDCANIEVDLFTRYLERLVQFGRGPQSPTESS